jgi:tetratricopeptide (TPR) repeat protein
MWWIVGWAAAQSIQVGTIASQGANGRYRGLGEALGALLEEDLVVGGMEVAEPGESAEWTVQGRWKVEGRDLSVVYNVVDASETVVAGYEGTGPVGDYLTVARESGLGLLERLGRPPSAGLKRRILGSEATESLDAAVDWGRGLAHAQEGEHLRAMARYEASLERDPGFDQALQALARSRRALADAAAEEVDDARLERIARLEKAVGKVKSELERKGRRTNVETTVRLGIRWAAMTDLGRHCEVADEIGHFLLRTGGDLPEREGDNYRRAVELETYNLGLGPRIAALDAKVEGRTKLDLPHPGVDRLVAGGPLSYLSATLACAGDSPRARIAAIDAAVERIASLEIPRQGERHPPARDQFRLARVAALAMVEGDSPAVLAELEALANLPVDAAGRVEVARQLRATSLVAAQVGDLRRVLRPLGIGDLLRIAEDLATTPEMPARCAKTKPVAWAESLVALERVLEDGAITVFERKKFVRASTLPVMAVLLGCTERPEAFPVGGARTWFTERAAAATPTEACAEPLAEAVARVSGLEGDGPALDWKILRSVVPELLLAGCIDAS